MTKYYVSTTGNSGNSGLSWAQAKGLPSQAWSIASTGDTIYVAAGTYIDNIVSANKLIQVVGAGMFDTIIQGTPKFGVATSFFTNGLSDLDKIKFSNLTLYYTSSPSYYLHKNAGINLENVILKGNGTASMVQINGQDSGQPTYSKLKGVVTYNVADSNNGGIFATLAGSYMDVQNSIFYDSMDGSGNGILKYTEAAGTQAIVKNNIFYDTSGVLVDPTLSSVVRTGNYYYSTTYTGSLQAGEKNLSAGEAATLFNNAAGGDFVPSKVGLLYVKG